MKYEIWSVVTLSEMWCDWLWLRLVPIKISFSCKSLLYPQYFSEVYSRAEPSRASIPFCPQGSRTRNAYKLEASHPYLEIRHGEIFGVRGRRQPLRCDTLSEVILDLCSDWRSSIFDMSQNPKSIRTFKSNLVIFSLLGMGTYTTYRCPGHMIVWLLILHRMGYFWVCGVTPLGVLVGNWEGYWSIFQICC